MSEETWTENYDYAPAEDGGFGDSMLPDSGLRNPGMFKEDPADMYDDVDALDLQIVEKDHWLNLSKLIADEKKVHESEKLKLSWAQVKNPRQGRRSEGLVRTNLVRIFLIA
jgi:hypothetical protein